MQGIKIYITILLNGSISLSDKKSIRLRKYPKPIIMIIDKIVVSIALIQGYCMNFKIYKYYYKKRKRKIN